MNRIKRLSMTGLVTLALATSALAGNIHTGVVNPPPPPPASSLMTDSESGKTPGEIDTGLVPSSLGTEIILNLLQVLSVY